jgi:hypothetical protein
MTAQIQKEVSESVFEYLIGEILHMNYPLRSHDQNAAVIHRLDSLGFEVGYR